MVNEEGLKKAFLNIKNDIKVLNSKIDKVSNVEIRVRNNIGQSFMLIKDDISKLNSKIEKLENIEKTIDIKLEKFESHILRDFDKLEKRISDKKEEKIVEKILGKEKKVFKEEVIKPEEADKSENVEYYSSDNLKDKTGKKGWVKNKFEKLVDFLAEEDE